MGKKRFERVANSTRPAAKLGGGGGWNIDGARGIVDGDPASLPAYPTPLSRRRVVDEGRVDKFDGDFAEYRKQLVAEIAAELDEED